MAATARAVEKLSRPAFRAFVETRPDEERWELIDGVAMMMNPPTRTHQRIASNLEAFLNDAFEAAGSPLVAYQRIGVTIAAAPDYDPEPDVLVTEDESADDHYVRSFVLAAEIVSRSDAARIDAKRAIYRLSPGCLAVLIIDQTKAAVTVEERGADGWTTRTLSGVGEELSLPALGVSFGLAALYRKTPLAG